MSYVIPARNAGMTIERALESLRAQTIDCWRAIVVDDGSTDDTGEIVRGIGDNRVELVRQPAHGVAAAREAGIQSLTDDQDLICFLDADDWVEPEHARRMSESIEAAEAIACGSAIANESGSAAGWSDAPTAWDLSLERLLMAPRLLIGGVAIRRSALERVQQEWRGLFDDSLHCEDWDFWLRLDRVQAKWAAPIGERLHWYRRTSSSRSRDLEPMHADGCAVIRAHAPNPDLRLAALRRHSLGSLARAMVCGAQELAQSLIPELGALDQRDLDRLVAELRWSLIGQGAQTGTSWRRLLDRLGQLGASRESLARRAAMTDDCWRALGRISPRTLESGQLLVIGGVGRNGRLVLESLDPADRGCTYWLDDNLAASAAGRRIEMHQLDQRHAVLVTPDDRAGFVERLRKTDAGRILLPEDLAESAPQPALA